MMRSIQMGVFWLNYIIQNTAYYYRTPLTQWKALFQVSDS